MANQPASGPQTQDSSSQAPSIRSNKDRYGAEGYEAWVQFSALLGRLAASFLHLTADATDKGIEEGLLQIKDFFTADCVVLLELKGNSSHPFLVSNQPNGERSDDEPSYQTSQALLSLPSLYEGKTLVLSPLPEAFPEELLKTDEQLWRDSGLKAKLALPLLKDGALLGLLCVDYYSSSKDCPTGQTDLLLPLGELFAAVLERRNAFQEVEELLEFEKLLSEISSMYANLPADQVDKTIDQGLERIGRFLNSDRCNLGQLTQDQDGVHILHSWSDEGIDAMPNFLIGTSRYFPWALNKLKLGEVVHYSRHEDLPDEAETDKKTLTDLGIKSGITVPIAVGGPVVGFLEIDKVRAHRSWPLKLANRLRILGEIFANALVRKEKELEIQNAFAEIKQLNNQLEADCSYLRQEIDLEHSSHNMIGQSAPLRHVFLKIQQIAPTDITVLILGETGVGKELVARAIHAASRRSERPMVKVNCAALPTNLIESELFGHEKGAFTSAQSRQVGRFELADGNTLFLDEIGELPLEAQSKLLRVIQEGEFERLGSSHTIRVDVRIIAATNRNLEEEVKKGRFRQDLWYRLNVFPVDVPPLRQRREDIPLLVNGLVDRSNRKLGKWIKLVPNNVMQALQDYPWPGNIRELENVIERAAITTQGSTLQLQDNLSPAHAQALEGAEQVTLEELERNHIVQVLTETDWRISGPKGAALFLGVNPSTLRYRMRKLGIRFKKSPDLPPAG